MPNRNSKQSLYTTRTNIEQDEKLLPLQGNAALTPWLKRGACGSELVIEYDENSIATLRQVEDNSTIPLEHGGLIIVESYTPPCSSARAAQERQA